VVRRSLLRSRPVLMVAFVFAVACTEPATEGEAPSNEADRPGGSVIEGDILLTAPPVEGAGDIPTFAWESVQGATAYRLGVLDADGELVWAWEGPETSVVLGGVPGRQPAEGGPVITPGSSWSVIAFDGRGLIVAISEVRSVSP
jgi:hypothetical protein